MTDFFLIWPHGLKYKDQIFGMINNNFIIKIYLLNMDPTVYIIFVESTNNKDVNILKWRIREQFNPKFEDLTFQPHKALSPGITHNHVIHSSDIPEETELLKKYLNDKLFL